MACAEFAASMCAFGCSIVPPTISGAVMPVSASRASGRKRSESASSARLIVPLPVTLTRAELRYSARNVASPSRASNRAAKQRSALPPPMIWPGKISDSGRLAEVRIGPSSG